MAALLTNLRSFFHESLNGHFILFIGPTNMVYSARGGQQSLKPHSSKRFFKYESSNRSSSQQLQGEKNVRILKNGKLKNER